MKNRIRCSTSAVRCALLILSALLLFPAVSSGQDPLTQLKDETLSYFKPLKGNIVSVEGDTIVCDIGAGSGIRKGMRVTIFKEGMPFLHPITKEPMGKVETPSGTAEVKEVNKDSSILRILKGNASVKDIVRISEIRIRVLFYQDRSVDWNLGDSYYQSLKKSGRFTIVDTSLDSADDARIVAEARKLNTEAVLILTEKDSDKGSLLKQRILWSDDASKLLESEVKVGSEYVKGLRAANPMTTPVSSAGDALLFFDLPYSGRLVTAGDFKGDRKQELVIGTSRELRVYTMSTNLENTYEIKGSSNDDFLWVDTMDVNGDGRDEIIVTSLRGRSVDVTSESMEPIIKDEGRLVSYVYGLEGSEFSLLGKANLFMRVLPPFGLIAQRYEEGGGYKGPVFRVSYQGGRFEEGEELKLPKGVNIYDFVFMEGPGGVKYTLAYDDSGRLSLYNETGLRVWQSKENYGGFPETFKRTSPTVMIGRGEWSIKDRLYVKGRESFAVKRIPLANIARGLGYKSSDIKTLWWTGFSMEENTLVEGISGAVTDYACYGDKLVVLSKPLFGFKPQNILKGESPLGSMLYVYSLRGM
jgi:hypothetical protein